MVSVAVCPRFLINVIRIECFFTSVYSFIVFHILMGTGADSPQMEGLNVWSVASGCHRLFSSASSVSLI